MTRIAIMQPYFFPYAGYFRLFMGVDAFVVLDNVQYLRRGWINRNRLHLANGELDWLTAPFAKGEFEMQILDLKFKPDASAILSQRMARFPAASQARPQTEPLIATALNPGEDGCAYLINLLGVTCSTLGITTPMVRASTLTTPDLKKEERLFAICEALKATSYVNAPGGVDLYDPAQFRARGIELQFHRPYDGPAASILQRLHDSPPEAVRCEIETNLSYQ